MIESHMQKVQRQIPAGRTRDAVGRRSPGGFTLIEMTLAVAILAIISLTVYRFTEVAIHAAGTAMQADAEDVACSGLRRLLAAQLGALPANQNGTLIGVNTTRKGGGRHDALQMVCPAGNAVLTPDAKGYYQITLDLREFPRGSDHWSLGMERTPWNDDDDDDDEDTIKPNSALLQTGRQQLPSDWVRLMDNVSSLEVAYFDSRLNGWVDKWTDQSNLPNLVRVRVTLAGNSTPYEMVERVPGGGLAKVIPTSILPGNNVNPTNGNSPAAPVINRNGQ